MCPNKIAYEGLIYPSVEHAYQAAKIQSKKVMLSDGTGYVSRSDFINLTASQVKKLGKKILLPHNWDDIKLEIMIELVNLKFQDTNFRKMLFDTGSKHLEERNSWGDVYWGTDETGRGENHLGKILMNIRAKI